MPEPTRLRLRDQIIEARLTLAASRRRQVPALLAVATSVAAALTIFSVAASGSAALNNELLRLRATEVTATVRASSDGRQVQIASPPVLDSEIAAIEGVTAAGVLLPGRQTEVRQIRDPLSTSGGGPSVASTNVYGASPGALRLITGHLPPGWPRGESGPSQRVATIGSVLARRLGIGRRVPTTIAVNSVPFVVVGVIENAERRPELYESIVMPPELLVELGLGGDSTQQVLITTRRGWAAAVGSQLANVIYPGDPTRIDVVVQPEPTRLSDAISTRTRSLVLAVAAVAWATGLVSIAGTVAAGVNERTPELALRRVFGARPSHLQRHVFTESAILGLSGGIIGCAVGWTATMIIVKYRGWWPVINIELWAIAPLGGVATGLLAGILPARLASRIDPAVGVRRD
ncbi:MAG: ABC transporter permease [Microthrixaceae bacterium]